MVCTSLGSLLRPLFYFLCYIHFSLSVIVLFQNCHNKWFVTIFDCHYILPDKENILLISDAVSANGAGNAEDPEVESRLRENAVTMNKMTDLRAQMEKLNVARRQKKVVRCERGFDPSLNKQNYIGSFFFKSKTEFSAQWLSDIFTTTDSDEIVTENQVI